MVGRNWNLGATCKAIARRIGLRYIILEYYLRTCSLKKRAFRFQKGTYEYFCHRYNTTWRNERAVEIPIIRRIMKGYPEHEILEVGNVLSHYFPIDHDILDKYEKAEGVINEDVISFQSAKKWSLVVSISTLEHVGWDERPREPMKILSAVENLKKLIIPKGRICVTLPLGYNTAMDELLKKRKLQFTKMYCLKRISGDNQWREVGWEDIRDAKYNSPFLGTNGLVIGIIEKG